MSTILVATLILAYMRSVNPSRISDYTHSV